MIVLLLLLLSSLLQVELPPQQMQTATVGRRVHGLRHQLGRGPFEKPDEIRLIDRPPTVAVAEAIAVSPPPFALFERTVRRRPEPVAVGVLVQTSPARGRSQSGRDRVAVAVARHAGRNQHAVGLFERARARTDGRAGVPLLLRAVVAAGRLVRRPRLVSGEQKRQLSTSSRRTHASKNSLLDVIVLVVRQQHVIGQRYPVTGVQQQLFHRHDERRVVQTALFQLTIVVRRRPVRRRVRYRRPGRTRFRLLSSSYVAAGYAMDEDKILRQIVEHASKYVVFVHTHTVAGGVSSIRTNGVENYPATVFRDMFSRSLDAIFHTSIATFVGRVSHTAR